MVVAVLAVAGLTVSSAPAMADSAVRSCHLQGAWNFTPAVKGYTLVKTTYKSSGVVNGCVSLPGPVPLSITGTYTLTGGGMIGCSSTGSTSSYTLTISWSDGTSSTITNTASLIDIIGLGVFNGSVTKGAMAGHAVTATHSPNPDDITRCIARTPIASTTPLASGVNIL